jgi:hypothetical protein
VFGIDATRRALCGSCMACARTRQLEAAVALAVLLPAASAIQYQNALAPPPIAAGGCQGWCPKWTCCKTCDNPACSGCGATRQCAEAKPSSEDAAAAASGVGGEIKLSKIAPPGFQTGSNGQLLANGKPFTVKGINWWGTEGPTRTFGGLKDRSMDGLLDFIKDNDFNAIRILVNHRAVMINGKLPAGEFDEGRTPELVNMRYLDQIELMVSRPPQLLPGSCNVAFGRT